MTTVVKEKKSAVEVAKQAVTKRVADFVVGTSYSKIPKEAIKVAKNVILDAIGCALAGSKEPAPEIVTEYVKELGGKREAGVITKGFKTSAPLAALANGTMAHVLDFDDTAASWFGHPSVVLMPTVFALGEKGKLSGKAILEAYILGFEVGSKVNLALGRAYYQAGWHSTIVAGTMATTAAAAKLMKLDVPQTRMALGIAASLASGFKRNFGTMTKSFHAGTAAKNGIIAASLAKKGFTADDSILEVPQGYGEMFSKEFDQNKITQGLGSPFDIVSPGDSVKPYSCCRAMHRQIDAMLYLIHEHNIRAADVAEVQCLTSPAVVVQLYYHQPKTGLEAKFSMEYGMAVALLDHDVKLAQFEDKRVSRRDVQELLRKVKYAYPKATVGTQATQPAQVTVRLKSGKEMSHEVRNAKGDPANPLTEKELTAKFHDCAQTALPERAITRSMEMLSKLETLPDISALMNILTKSRDT
ncbi:MAG: MmgE/PrpD family protein [Chloroflexota bacterium]